MKIETNVIQRACGKIAKIKYNKDYPISEYTLLSFKAETQNALLRATDGYIFVEVDMPCEGVEQDCDFIVEANKLIKLVGKTTKDVMTFVAKDNCLKVKGNGSYSLEVIDEDFLEIPDYTNAQVCETDFKVLKPALLDAIKCKSGMSNQPLMSGVCVNKDSVWGTDVCKFVSNEFETGIEDRILLSDLICTLIPCLDGAKGIIYPDIENLSCAMKVNDTLIYGQLLEGAEMYPDLGQLFSGEDKAVVTVNKNEVLQAMDRLSIFTDETDAKVAIAVIEEGVGLSVGGKSVEQLEVKSTFNIVPTTLIVSMSAFKDIVSIMQNDYIELQYHTDDEGGALFVSDGITNGGVALSE